MSDLIKALEEAEKGSLVLDGRVEVAIRDVFAARSGLAREHWAKWRSNAAGFVSDGDTTYGSDPVTTSVDAALALASRVLPGWFPAVEPRFFIDGEVVRWKATLIRPLWDQYNPVTDEWFDRIENRTASTPALALCAAILRASEQERGG